MQQCLKPQSIPSFRNIAKTRPWYYYCCYQMCICALFFMYLTYIYKLIYTYYNTTLNTQQQESLVKKGKLKKKKWWQGDHTKKVERYNCFCLFRQCWTRYTWAKHIVSQVVTHWHIYTSGDCTLIRARTTDSLWRIFSTEPLQSFIWIYTCMTWIIMHCSDFTEYLYIDFLSNIHTLTKDDVPVNAN